MTKSVLEAYDLISFAVQTSTRVSEMAPVYESQLALEREKAWLASAMELLASESASCPALLDRAKSLPELKVVRQESTSDLIGLWVDALEKLLAGFTFHLGSRAPIIQALFVHQKMPQLRRTHFESATDYATEFERRLRSSYVARLLDHEDFTFAKPVVEHVLAAWAAVKTNESDSAIPAEEAKAIAAELTARAESIERVLRQARLIAEAALLSVEGALGELGLDAKPKKRSAKATVVAEAESPAENELDADEAPEVEAEDEEEAAAPVEVEAKPEPPAPPAPAPARARKNAKTPRDAAAAAAPEPAAQSAAKPAADEAPRDEADAEPAPAAAAELESEKPKAKRAKKSKTANGVAPAAS